MRSNDCQSIIIYIQKDHAPDFDFGMDNFSLMFWFKAENQNKPAVLLSKASDWGTLDAFKGFVIGNSDFDYAGLESYINSNGEGDNKNCVAKTPDTMNLFDNQWHMVVAVRENNQIRLYIDGGGDNKTFTADGLKPNAEWKKDAKAPSSYIGTELVVDEFFPY